MKGHVSPSGRICLSGHYATTKSPDSTVAQVAARPFSPPTTTLTPPMYSGTPEKFDAIKVKYQKPNNNDDMVVSYFFKGDASTISIVNPDGSTLVIPPAKVNSGWSNTTILGPALGNDSASINVVGGGYDSVGYSPILNGLGMGTFIYTNRQNPKNVAIVIVQDEAVTD